MTLQTDNVQRILAIDSALRDRAIKVIPGGMYGHTRVHGGWLPPSFPQYYSRGAGARLWDVDGNEYVDFLCGYGPMIAGYANPEIDAAAKVRQELGDVLDGPTADMIEAAELLVDTVAHADWAVFAKNGTDATSMAVVIARAATGKTKLLKARVAYHGANPWFTPLMSGVTQADRANIIEYDYNDLASVEAAIQEADGDLAAIIATPFRHDGWADQEFADVEFARGIRELATRYGAALILDEVRTGFRLDPRGAWEGIGVRPDLTAFSKALANGYALAAVVGVESFREATTGIYVTGSFWHGSVSLAAAVKTLEILRSPEAVETMVELGTMLGDGLRAQAKEHGWDLVISGPPQMLALRFEHEESAKAGFAFADAAIRRGVILHPWHNMFLSAAHTVNDIERALAATDDAFAELDAVM
jgi:glutamate-1-semialdehyde 2,1-aminomutase